MQTRFAQSKLFTLSCNNIFNEFWYFKEVFCVCVFPWSNIFPLYGLAKVNIFFFFQVRLCTGSTLSLGSERQWGEQILTQAVWSYFWCKCILLWVHTHTHTTTTWRLEPFISLCSEAVMRESSAVLGFVTLAEIKNSDTWLKQTNKKTFFYILWLFQPNQSRRWPPS